MNSSRARRAAWLILGIVVLVVVGAGAYALGVNNHSNGAGLPHMMRGYGGWLGMGGYGGFDGFGIFGLFWILLLVLLFVFLLSALFAPSAGSRSSDPAGLDRLKELSEMHDKGALTDEEFSAAKRKLLGL